MTDLGTLGGTNSAAYAVNNNGQIAGYSQSASEATHVFLYTGGKLTDLGQYNIDTVPAAINDSGQILCEADQTGTGNIHAFLLTPAA